MRSKLMFKTPAIAAVKGFTLAELMVAVAIMGITVAIGLPSLQSTIASNRLSTAANDMVLALNVARSEAIKQVVYAGVDIQIEADGSSKSWNTFADITTNVIQKFYAPTGIIITVTSSGATDETPRYRADGRLDSLTPITMEFSVTNGSTEKRLLTIKPSGRVTVEKV